MKKSSKSTKAQTTQPATPPPVLSVDLLRAVAGGNNGREEMRK